MGTSSRPPATAHRPRSTLLTVACSGIGHVHRGYERILAEVAEKLSERMPVRLFQGAGTPRPGGETLPCIRRSSWLGQRLPDKKACRLEIRSFSLPLLFRLLRRPSDVVYIADYRLAKILRRFRRVFPRKRRFALAFHNGAPKKPRHLHWADLVHQVTLPAQEQAQSEGLFQSRLLPIPVDCSRFLPDPCPAVRLSLGISRNEIVVLCAAAHEPFKRLDLAIRAVALARQMAGGECLSLLIAGENGSQSVELRQLARQLAPDRVYFHRFAPEAMPGAMNSADIFLAPSLPEGFGIVIVEAMSAGLPVVVNDDPRKRWIVEDVGLVVDTANTERLARLLADLASDPDRRHHLSLTSRKRAVATFSWKLLTPRYHELILTAKSLARTRPDARGGR